MLSLASELSVNEQTAPSVASSAGSSNFRPSWGLTGRSALVPIGRESGGIDLPNLYDRTQGVELAQAHRAREAGHAHALVVVALSVVGVVREPALDDRRVRLEEEVDVLCAELGIQSELCLRKQEVAVGMYS